MSIPAKPLEQNEAEPTLSGMHKLIQRIIANLSMIGLLECREASLSFIKIICLAIATLILVLTAWAGLMVVIALLLAQLGVSLLIITAMLIMVQLVVAALLIFYIYQNSQKLLFPNTRKALAALQEN